MGSRVYDNDVSSNTVIDNRNAAGDNALLNVGGTLQNNSGNTTTTTNTTTTNNSQTTSNSGNVTTTTTNNQAISNSGNTTTTNTTSNSQTTSNSGNTSTISDAYNTTNNTQHVTNTTVEPTSLLELTRQLPTIFSNNNKFASDTVAQVAGAQNTLTKLIGDQGDLQRGFAGDLVKDVLSSSRTGDERQTENFLKFAVAALGIMALVFIVPQFAKGAR